MEKFGKAVAFLIGLFLGILWKGYIISILWGWFITTTFNITSITYVQAVGISTLFTYLKTKTNNPSKSDMEERDMLYYINEYLIFFVHGAMTLGVGYIVHLFM